MQIFTQDITVAGLFIYLFFFRMQGSFFQGEGTVQDCFCFCLFFFFNSLQIRAKDHTGVDFCVIEEQKKKHKTNKTETKMLIKPPSLGKVCWMLVLHGNGEKECTFNF